MYPWNTVWAGIKQAKTFALGYPGGVYVIEAASVGALLTLGAMGVRRISLPLWSWIWICILPSLLAPFPGRMLMSSVRFTAVIFPAFLILATYVKRPSLDQGIRYVFAGTYAIAVAMYVCGHYMF